MTTNPLSPAEQIAAINRKSADEHRRVDMQHDQLIQVVRDRCVHESDFLPIGFVLSTDGGQGLVKIEAIHCPTCGAPMGAEEA